MAEINGTADLTDTDTVLRQLFQLDCGFNYR